MKLFLDPLLGICGLFMFEILFYCILGFLKCFKFLVFLDFGFELGDFFFHENIFLIELMKLFVEFLLFFEMGHFLLALLCSFVPSDRLL